MILLGVTATSAYADLSITLSNETIGPDAIGTMNIYASSNAGDQLNYFNLELLITTIGSPTSLLEFTTSQADFSTNPDYVFYNNSSNDGAFWRPPYTTNTLNDTISGGDTDSADSGNGYVTLPTTNVLIAQVQFQAAPGATPGNQFQVSLVSDPSFTTFQDPNSNAFNYTVNADGGVVTIGAVPEPASSTMWAISILCGLLWHRRHRKASVTANSKSDQDPSAAIAHSLAHKYPHSTTRRSTTSSRDSAPG